MHLPLLVVDLTQGLTRSEDIDLSERQAFIGGSGLAVRLLWDTLDPRRDPLHEESPVLWMTGPLTGSGGPTTGRSSICGRSPLTGLWGESNIGGFVGSEIRYAGFDGIRITGRASSPVYLWVHDGEAEIRDASALWGKTDTYDTQRAIKQGLNEPRARVACVGLAGENLVPYASIMSDHGRAAGRTGMGALFGSKNLKAIAVRGRGSLTFERDQEYRRLRVEANKALMDENMTAVFRDTGTSGAADYLELLGDLPKKYWTQGVFESVSRISGATMAETILTRKTACQGCIISCGRAVTINEGPYVTHGEVKGPEYETIGSFGSQILVDDLALITALGNRCDEVGLDTISAGNTIALAYLMFDRGILSVKDTDGLELRWGDGRPCFDLIDKIAHREGFGHLLAQGSRALARHFGVEELAVHVNGLEVPMHDPRAMTGQAVAYVTSPRGACHNQSDYYQVEMGASIPELDIPMTERHTDSGKGHYVARHQDWRTVFNSLVICLFAAISPSAVVQLLTAATGHDWTVEEMMTAGERAFNLKRAYNCRLGMTRASEKLPDLLKQALPDGGTMGHVPDMDTLMREYYQARGWDQKTGWPSNEKLQALGLDFAVR
jgi:aldehyde:ferredoxin oxidoreductase